MVTRLYEWDKNETGWTWIEITANKVVNLILRSLNNLIHVNDNNEVYVDLQLEDWIADDDTLPIWVNVGRVLAADGRPVTWTLISWQTTSGDRVKVLYGDDWNIYVDNWTGTFTMLVNTRTFYITSSIPWNYAEANAAYNWYKSGHNPILVYLTNSKWQTAYSLYSASQNELQFRSATERAYSSHTETEVGPYLITLNISNDAVTSITFSTDMAEVLETNVNYATPYTPQYDWSPATKKYVDDKVIIDSNAPATPQAWQFWYDTTNSTLSLYDGTQRLSI